MYQINDLNATLMVDIASKQELVTDFSMIGQDLLHVGPQRTGPGQQLDVAQHVESVPSTLKGYADAIGSFEKSDRIALVIAHQ